MSIAINKKIKFDGARCPFSTFLRLQGDHHCACAPKWRHFSFFFQELSNKKKIKALRPKMTKIASRGGSCLKTFCCDSECHDRQQSSIIRQISKIIRLESDVIRPFSTNLVLCVFFLVFFFFFFFFASNEMRPLYENSYMYLCVSLWHASLLNTA